jgi:hypothetical protein
VSFCLFLNYFLCQSDLYLSSFIQRVEGIISQDLSQLMKFNYFLLILKAVPLYYIIKINLQINNITANNMSKIIFSKTPNS